MCLGVRDAIMELGQTLPIWSIIPFAGMLLSIAVFPLVKAEWWEKHQLLVSLAWALLFLVPTLFIVFQTLQEKVKPLEFDPDPQWAVRAELEECKNEKEEE